MSPSETDCDQCLSAKKDFDDTGFDTVYMYGIAIKAVCEEIHKSLFPQRNSCGTQVLIFDDITYLHIKTRRTREFPTTARANITA